MKIRKIFIFSTKCQIFKIRLIVNFSFSIFCLNIYFHLFICLLQLVLRLLWFQWCFHVKFILFIVFQFFWFQCKWRRNFLINSNKNTMIVAGLPCHFLHYFFVVLKLSFKKHFFWNSVFLKCLMYHLSLHYFLDLATVNFKATSCLRCSKTCSNVFSTVFKPLLEFFRTSNRVQHIFVQLSKTLERKGKKSWILEQQNK